jgi:hypothetical protein
LPATCVLRIRGIPSLGVAVLCASGALQPASANESHRIASMQIEELKGVYLGCEQAAAASRLGGDDVMYCSLIYEELKERAFGGEFRRIKSWLDRQKMPLG